MNQDKKPLFCGVATALVTPFTDGRLDMPALRRLLSCQLEGGVDALVLCGTTGEAPTLTEGEMCEVIFAAKQAVGDKIPLVVGTGTNCTDSTLRRSRMAAAEGADGLLVVTPYYNKGTREGLVRHYLTVAEAATVPIIVYNVPTRTGVDISLDALGRLADHDNIAGIKEAGGNFDKIAECIRRYGDSLPLYSGNDSQILPTLALGSKGVISVVSNVLPRETAALCRAFFEGALETAQAWQLKLLPLMQALFADTNPAPVKAALSLQGLCREELRLPLAPVEEALRQRLQELLTDLGVPMRQ